MASDNDEFDKITSDSEVKKSEVIDKDILGLQQENEDLKKNDLTQKFCILLIILIAFDALAFSHFENWGSSIVLGIFELILLIVIGKKFGIEDIAILTDKILSTIRSNVRKKKTLK